MQTMLTLAEGPLFRFALVVLILGLGRHVLLSIWGYLRARHTAGGHKVHFAPTLWQTVRYGNPLRYLFRTRGLYSALTALMHVGLIVVPLFLAGHIVLWERSLGFAWFGLPAGVADILTLLTIATAVAVLVARAAYAGSRRISRFQDWLFPPLIVVLFGSGFLMAHPPLDVLPYPASRLIHVLTGNLLLVLIPTTKLAHMVLLPFSRAVAEVGWRFVPGSGDRVQDTLGKEGHTV